MTLVDLAIVVFVISLAAIGWQRGLVASALPLAGFVGGAALGARIGPELLAEGAESSYAPLVAVLTGVLLGAFLAVAIDGVSRRLRSRMLGRLDSASSTGSAARSCSRPWRCCSSGGSEPSRCMRAATAPATCAGRSSGPRSSACSTTRCRPRARC